MPPPDKPNTGEPPSGLKLKKPAEAALDPSMIPPPPPPPGKATNPPVDPKKGLRQQAAPASSSSDDIDLQLEEKKDGNNTAMVISVVVLAILFLGGGVVLVAMGLMGLFSAPSESQNTADEAAAPQQAEVEAVPPPQVATDPSEPSASTTTRTPPADAPESAGPDSADQTAEAPNAPSRNTAPSDDSGEAQTDSPEDRQLALQSFVESLRDGAPTESELEPQPEGEAAANVVDVPADDTEDPREITIEVDTTREDSPAETSEAPRPDPLVREWLARAHIGGSTSQRILLEGQFYDLNEVVIEDPATVRWVGRDSQLRVLYFEDVNGIVYEKDY